jgi:hypothetical protein
MAVTNQNCIHEEIKSKLNLGNACYQAVQNILSSYLLSKNVKIKIHKTIILQRLRVVENRALRIFGPKRDKVTGGWTKLHNEELHNLYSSPNIY